MKEKPPTLDTQIQPLGDRVLVFPLEPEQTTTSGIVIPDTAKGEKPTEGIVLALGPGGIGKDCPNPHDFLDIGEKVLFGRYAGDDVKLKDHDGKLIVAKLLHLDAVLGVVL